ncbi:choline transporter-like protein 1 [Sabethes cyaneus]|uniref:choline transporter-like protein 1 n=1 Tax=Sabethes cyaneus TaxID=53552 RepID=UPI00237ED684|nr:choline transporter-like protein 1 [Sabethes cyaneus]
MSVKGAKSSTFVDSSDVEEVIYRKDRQCTDVVALIIMAVYMVGLTTILLLATFALGIYFILIIESTGKPAVIGNSVVYEKKALVHAARWYNIIALIWFSCFLFDCQHMVTAGAIAAWYFTRNKHGLNNAEGRSCSVLIKYHLGSVALGSLILAVTVLIRFIVKLLQKIATQTRSGYIACIALVCACIFNCIRSIVEMIQRNAYILVALQGLPFFKAGKSAVKLMMADAPNFVSVYAITNIVFLLAKWSVLLSVGSAAVVVLQMKHDLYHPYVLVAILGLVIYLITHCFMAVYEMTVATIFLCFCKDIQLNNGTDRPYYMSNNLGKFLPNAVQSETAQQNQASMS